MLISYPASARKLCFRSAGFRNSSTSENDQQKNEINSLRTALEKANSISLLRLADLDNARKQKEAELEKVRKYGVASFGLKMCEIADHLEKLNEGNQSTNELQSKYDSTTDGLKMVLNELKAKLLSFGIHRFETKVGDPFDPVKHFALMPKYDEDVSSVNPSDEYAGHNITTVHQPGYIIGDRVLRPAKVSVN